MGNDVDRRTLLQAVGAGVGGLVSGTATAQGTRESRAVGDRARSRQSGDEGRRQSTPTADQFRETARLRPGDGIHEFGRESVGVTDGTILVGSRWEDRVYPSQNQPGPGTVYVYSATETGWEQTGTLTPTNGDSDDIFGWSIAVEGEVALVGAEWNRNSESVYVFERSDGTWTQQATLSPASAEPGLFGDALDLSGTTALVGARNEDPSGAAYVFEREASGWQQQARLTPPDGGLGDLFGWGLGIDGTTAVVGARGHATGAGDDAGAAYVFERSGGTWRQEATLTPDDAAAGDEFGEDVAVAGDVALVGARGDDAAGESASGAAYVFERAGGTWTQQAKLTPATDSGDLFSDTVALAGDTALVESNGDGEESVAVFDRAGGDWEYRRTIVPNEGSGASIESMAMTDTTALFRTRDDDNEPGERDGVTHVFERSGGPTLGTAGSGAQSGTPLEDRATDEEAGTDPATGTPTATTGASGPGFGAGAALTALVSTGYLLRRRFVDGRNRE